MRILLAKIILLNLIFFNSSLAQDIILKTNIIEYKKDSVVQIELIFMNNSNQDLFFHKCIDANTLLKNQDRFAISLFIQNSSNHTIVSSPLNYINLVDDSNIDIKCRYVCKPKEKYKLRISLYDSYRIKKLENYTDTLFLKITMFYQKNGVLQTNDFQEVIGCFNSQNVLIR